MAILKSTATGNFTDSTTWSTIIQDAGGSYNMGVATLFSFVPASTTTYSYTSQYAIVSSQTVQGVILYINAISATPTGTMTVGVFTGAGTTPLASVEINVSDLVDKTPAPIAFKYTSTTVIGGANYRIGVRTSDANMVQLGRTNVSTTDWLRASITTTAATPGSLDTIWVMGELTGAGTSNSYNVTMNVTSSATTYGPLNVSDGGVFAYGTAGSTNYYYRQQGTTNIFRGGTFTIGTSVNPIPSTSTARYDIFQTTPNQFPFTIYNGTVTTFGATKTPSAKLAANVAAGATTITTDISTGWLSGDQLIIPPTNRVQGAWDTRTLNGNASGTNLTLNSALTFAHETSPSTPTATDIMNLTRNVQITGQGSALIGSNVATMTINGGNVSFKNTAFVYFGNSATLGVGGVQPNLTVANSSLSFDGCSFYGTTTINSIIFYNQSTQATSTMSFTNNVVYNGVMNVGSNAALTPSTVIFDRSILFRAMFITQRMFITLTNFTVAGSNAAGFAFNDTSITTANGGRIGTFNNLITYCNSNPGFSFFVPGGSSNTYAYGTMSNLTAWRNLQQGFYHIGSAPQPLFISGMTLTSNGTTNNIQLLGSGQIYMKNVTTSSNATFATIYALAMGASDKVYIVDSTLGSPVAEATAAIVGGLNGVVYPANLCFYNTTFAAGYPAIIGSQSQLPGRSTAYGISSMNHNGVANSTFNWQQTGTITTDSTIFDSSTYSMRMTPINANQKMYSHPFRMAMDANTTATISVRVRKSVVGDGTAYNGSQPRMLLAPSPYIDSPLNTVLATASAAAGTWETLTATFTPTATGVYEFILDCDGSTGWVNVDDWSTNYVRDTTKMDYWFMGMPDVNITGIPKERSVGFVY